MNIHRIIIAIIALMVISCSSPRVSYEYCGITMNEFNGYQGKHKLPFLHDLAEALDCAKELKKPVLVVFTGYACVGYDSFRLDMLKNRNVRKFLKNEYITVVLYVDDKSPLLTEESEVRERYEQHGIELDSNRKIHKIGHLNSTIQYMEFNDNSQVYYGFLKPNGEHLIPSFHYNNREVDFLLEKLQKGMEVWKSSAN